MANPAPASEFKATFSSIGIQPGSAGSLVAVANVEGTASGYGPFVGTMSAAPAGSKSGTWQYCGIGWLDDGGTLSVTGQGTFESVGTTRWRQRGLLHDNLGRVMSVDAEIDLASHAWTGKISAAG